MRAVTHFLRTFVATVLCLGTLVSVTAVTAAPPAGAVSTGIPVMGPNRLNARQLANWFRATGRTPLIPSSIEQLAQYYISEGNAEGVRGDIAFAQEYPRAFAVLLHNHRAAQNAPNQRIGPLHPVLAGTNTAQTHPCPATRLRQRGIDPLMHLLQQLHHRPEFGLDRDGEVPVRITESDRFRPRLVRTRADPYRAGVHRTKQSGERG